MCFAICALLFVVCLSHMCFIVCFSCQVLMVMPHVVEKSQVLQDLLEAAPSNLVVTLNRYIFVSHGCMLYYLAQKLLLDLYASLLDLPYDSMLRRDTES